MPSIATTPPRTWSTRWLPLGAASVTWACALLIYIATAAPTITTRFGGTDGGELAAVALSGGVAHPSGYPTYLLLARLALYVPLGEPAARLALFSALCGALAAGVSAAFVTWRVASAGRPGLAFCAGVYSGLSFALSSRAWSQAIIVEVYALYMLWMAICVWLVVAWLSTAGRWLLFSALLCLGLGLGIHLTLLIVAPAACMAWIATPQRPQLPFRTNIGALSALVLGLAVYGCLPLWAARTTWPSWGDQRTLYGFWTHVSGSEYRYLVGVVPWREQLGRIGYATRDLLNQPGWIGMALGLGWGFPYGWREQRPLLLLTAIIALGSLGFAASYGGADSTVYLLPWTWVWCLWAGFGVYALGALLAPAHRTWLIGGLLLLALDVGRRGANQAASLSLHGDTRERDRRIAQLRTLPDQAVLLSSDDATTFGAWYVQRALGIRPDIDVIDTRLVSRQWYQAQIQRRLDGTNRSSLCAAIGSRPLWRGAVEGGVQPEPNCRLP